MRMISGLFITCAVTGAVNSIERNPHVLVNPDQIANSGLRETGGTGGRGTLRRSGGSRKPALYREAVLLSAAGVNLKINLRAKMRGGRSRAAASPLPLDPSADVVRTLERLCT
ncbi:hypothetical protein [Bradyrhizobium sp. RT6a]|uniref:hypothetical protein n=1 Tax=Bradyrhizobium sp. RT6a TaxID=3156381 RepID=UPI003396C730